MPKFAQLGSVDNRPSLERLRRVVEGDHGVIIRLTLVDEGVWERERVTRALPDASGVDCVEARRIGLLRAVVWSLAAIVFDCFQVN